MKIPLSQNPLLIAAISERHNGSMSLHGHTILDTDAYKHRAAFFHSLDIHPGHVITAGLIHSENVEAVSGPILWGSRVKDTDALVTDQKDTYLAITAGDCPPLYLYDPVKEVIGLAHCGWKGILAGVVENTIARMKKEFNCDPKDILAYIGPGIGPCHFEVSEDVAMKFSTHFKEKKHAPIPDDPEGRWEIKDAYYVDLGNEIYERLALSDIRNFNISVSVFCTYCAKVIPELKPLPEKSVIQNRFFSYRRDRSNPLETQLAVIGIRK